MALFFLAIAAGFLTVLAPCVLPVLPIILATGGRSRWRPVMIVIGFALSFSLLGAAFATFGSFLGVSNGVFRVVAGSALILFGLALLFEPLYERLGAGMQSALATLGMRAAGGAASRTDAASGILVGLSLGLVWTPCAGPILGSILTIASRTSDYVTTLLLLFAYSLGAGVPMLAIAYGGQALRTRLLAARRWQRAFSIVFGLLVIAMAVAILTGYDTVLSAALFDLYPTSFTSRL